jgi:hypothetical protein
MKEMNSGFGDSIGCDEIGCDEISGVGEGCTNEEEWV